MSLPPQGQGRDKGLLDEEHAPLTATAGQSGSHPPPVKGRSSTTGGRAAKRKTAPDLSVGAASIRPGVDAPATTPPSLRRAARKEDAIAVTYAPRGSQTS